MFWINWKFYAVFSAILGSIGQIFEKHQVSKASAFQVLIAKYTSSLLLTFFLLVIFYGLNGIKNLKILFLFYGFLAGFSIASRTAATRSGLAKTILISPIQKLIAVTLAFIILSEWQIFNPKTVQGQKVIFGLLLIPLILFLFSEKQKPTGIKTWSNLCLLYIVLGGTLVFISKFLLIKTQPLFLLPMQYLGSLMTCSLVLIPRKMRIIPSKKFFITGFIQGLITSTGVVFYYTALKLTPLTKVTLVRTPLVILLTVLSGLFIFQERKKITLRKIFGIICSFILLIITLSI